MQLPLLVSTRSMKMPWTANRINGSVPERGRCPSVFVRQYLGVSQPEVVIERGVHVAVADHGIAMGTAPCRGVQLALVGLGAAAVDRQPPPSGIRPSFFMSTWSGRRQQDAHIGRAFALPDGLAGHQVNRVLSGHPFPDEYPMHR